MKTRFIEVKSDIEFKLKEQDIEKLPKKIALATTVQFIDCLEKIKKQLEEHSKTCIIGKGRQKYPGQVLGCDVSSIEKLKADAFLYIGDGRFHPIAIRLNTEKDVFVLTTNSRLKKVEKKEVEDYKRKIKVGYTKFLSSSTIGLITSTKPGQNKIKEFKNIIDRYKDKRFYTFVCDTLDFSELENFPFIESWVNALCPRTAIDDFSRFNKPVINIEDLK